MTSRADTRFRASCEASSTALISHNSGCTGGTDDWLLVDSGFRAAYAAPAANAALNRLRVMAARDESLAGSNRSLSLDISVSSRLSRDKHT